MKKNKPLTLKSQIHLKKIDNPISICGATEQLSKELFQVTCMECLDLVITKRLKEISFLDKAKQEQKSLDSLGIITKKELTIRG
jgi:hypothetical protein